MRPLSIRQPSYRARASLPSRGVALLIALAISGLLVLMLLRLGLYAGGPPGEKSGPTVVTLLPAESEEAPAKQQQEQRPPPPVAKSVIIVPKRPDVPLPPTKLDMLVLTPEEFAASDISRLSPSPAQQNADSGASASAGDDQSVGRGPNGEKLYNAEWYREPTHAEMSPYLRDYATESGWAMIACKTVERYHVEDCQELGESPPGSGLSRALRQAAWQFLVRPPRVGGKPLVGEWVRIRFDFREEKHADRN